MDFKEPSEDLSELEKSHPRGALAFIWETIKIVLVSAAIVIPIRYYVVQPFIVNGASMEETFNDGEYILIDEISYRFKDPKRGDIVVFRFPHDKVKFFIKRIVGMPGETIEIKNSGVMIFNKDYPGGIVLDESGYLSPGQRTTGDLRIKLDPNEYFVLGDNRLQSFDSRRWGAVNRSLISGRVFFRAWPFNEFGTID